MAIVDVTVTATRSFTGYQRGVDDARANATIAPRGTVTFAVEQAIAATVAANQTHIIGTCTFDRSFAYRMIDLTCSMVSSAGSYTNTGYNNSLVYEIVNGSPSFARQWRSVYRQSFNNNVTSGFFLQPATVARQTLAWQATDADKNRTFIRNAQGTDPTLVFYLADESAAAEPAGTLFFQASFLVYDINQVTDVTVNSALPVINQ